jgi:hypothetical protein
MNNIGGLAEISSTYMWWLQCVKAAKTFPHSKVLQANAQRAQMSYLCIQAIYLASGRS